MVNMKLTPEEAKEEDGVGTAAASDRPEYPYGLTINLDDKVLAKLGISSLPTPGTKMTLRAVTEVATASQYESQGGKDISITLQITDMELAQAADADPKSLYPNSGMN